MNMGRNLHRFAHGPDLFFFHCLLCAEKWSTINNWKIVCRCFCSLPAIVNCMVACSFFFSSKSDCCVLHGGVCHQSFQFHQKSKFPGRVRFLFVFRELYYRRRKRSTAIQLLLFFLSFVVVFFFFFFFSSSSSSFFQKCSELGAAGCVPLSVLTQYLLSGLCC